MYEYEMRLPLGLLWASWSSDQAFPTAGALKPAKKDLALREIFLRQTLYLEKKTTLKTILIPATYLAGHSSCFRVPAAFFCCSPLICPVNRRRAGGEPTLPNSVNISSIHPTMRTEHKSTDFCGARKFQREEQLRQFCKHVYHENRLVSASRYIVLWSFYK